MTNHIIKSNQIENSEHNIIKNIDYIMEMINSKQDVSTTFSEEEISSKEATISAPSSSKEAAEEISSIVSATSQFKNEDGIPLSSNNDKVYTIDKCPKFTLNHNSSNVIKTDIKIPFERETERLAYTLHNILTIEQCNDLINFCDKYLINLPYALAAGSNGKFAYDYRYVWRKLIDCPLLIQKIEPILMPFLPKKFKGWELSRLNERMRFLKYEPGQLHSPHRDATYKDKATGEQTVITIMVYLDHTEDLIGGCTQFLDPQNHKNTIDIKPTPGSMLVFEHRVFHSGEALKKGGKHALRIDALYKRTSESENIFKKKKKKINNNNNNKTQNKAKNKNKLNKRQRKEKRSGK